VAILDKVKKRLRDWLEVEQDTERTLRLRQVLNFYTNAYLNFVWYRGKSKELEDIYKDVEAAKEMFWKAIPSEGYEIRKIHTAIPRLIIRTMTNIIMHDYNGVDVEEIPLGDIWRDVEADSRFYDEVLKKAVKNTQIVGDGAFKVSYDRKINSDLPIIEFISGENIEFEIERGRITEVIFITRYEHKDKKYYFREHYGINYIRYELTNENDKPIPLDSIPQTEWIQSDGVTFTGDCMLAVPVRLGASEQFDGRGESLFEGKLDAFDALDEAFSQWMDALRAGRAKTYFPDSLLPRDMNTGEILKPNSFDDRFIRTESDTTENGRNAITVVQPGIPHESYLSTYITALDLALQGLISPSTLGIDVKKLDNAEAQREKEKVTLYTRGLLVDLFSEVIPEVVKSVIIAYQNLHQLPIEYPTASVNFGEYANPSFESIIETMAKARPGHNLISVETTVEELYGDSKTEEWKIKEVERLKAEQGLVDMSEPAVNVF
jgi:hypothetical protein